MPRLPSSAWLDNFLVRIVEAAGVKRRLSAPETDGAMLADINAPVMKGQCKTRAGRGRCESLPSSRGGVNPSNHIPATREETIICPWDFCGCSTASNRGNSPRRVVVEFPRRVHHYHPAARSAGRRCPQDKPGIRRTTPCRCRSAVNRACNRVTGIRS